MFKIYMCDATHHKIFGSVLTSADEFYRLIVFILDGIIFLVPISI